MDAVTYGNGLFVAVGQGGTHQVMTSPDGVTWTARTAAEANSWDSVTYGNGQFVAVWSGTRCDDLAGRHHMDDADGGGRQTNGTPSPTATACTLRCDTAARIG